MSKKNEIDTEETFNELEANNDILEEVDEEADEDLLGISLTIADELRNMVVTTRGNCKVGACDDELVLTDGIRTLVLSGEQFGSVLYGCNVTYGETNKYLEEIKVKVEEALEIIIVNYNRVIDEVGFIPKCIDINNIDADLIYNISNVRNYDSDILNLNLSACEDFYVSDLPSDDKYYILSMTRLENDIVLFLSSPYNSDGTNLILKGTITREEDKLIGVEELMKNINISFLKPLMFRELYSLTKSRELLYSPPTITPITKSEVEELLIDGDKVRTTPVRNWLNYVEDLYYAFIDETLYIYGLNVDVYEMVAHITNDEDELPLYITLPLEITLPSVQLTDLDSHIAEAIVELLPRHNVENRCLNIDSLVTEETIFHYLDNISKMEDEDRYKTALANIDKLAKNLNVVGYDIVRDSYIKIREGNNEK